MIESHVSTRSTQTALVGEVQSEVWTTDPPWQLSSIETSGATSSQLDRTPTDVPTACRVEDLQSAAVVLTRSQPPHLKGWSALAYSSLDYLNLGIEAGAELGAEIAEHRDVIVCVGPRAVSENEIIPQGQRINRVDKVIVSCEPC